MGGISINNTFNTIPTIAAKLSPVIVTFCVTSIPITIPLLFK